MISVNFVNKRTNTLISVTVPVDRNREIRAAERTNQIAEFISMPF